ncbi:MAG: hypothetical protein ACI8QC_004299 [Planctomycetota bacterium]|jgi:hypothetical protein
MTVLLVYLRGGAATARRLIAGIVLANIGVSVLSFISAQHMSSPDTLNYLGLPVEQFVTNPRVLIAGTIILAVDVLAVIVVFERLNFKRRMSQEARIVITLGLVLPFDAVGFATLGFVEEPIYGS